MADLKATTVDGTLTDLRQENVKTGNHTLALADRNRVVAMTNTTDATVTVPNNTSVAFPVGSVVYICRLGTGNVTLSAASGVTITRAGTMGQYEEIYLRKRDTNAWVVVDVPRTPGGSGGTVSAASGYTIHTYTSGTSTFSVA